VTHLESSVARSWNITGHNSVSRCGRWGTRWYVALGCLIAALSACSLHASGRKKTDVVYMKNGDKITCEIRSLSQGQLTIKQDYANSTVVLDWLKVDHIESSQRFVVIDTKGHSASGKLSETSSDHILSIEEITEEHIPHADVVGIEETGKTFFGSLQGDVDVGLSFAQSNAQKNLTVQGDLNYQGKKDIAFMNVSSQFASQTQVSNTNETTAKTGFFRELRKSKWYGGGIANFLSSSEQQIDLQTTLGGALAIRPIYTNKTNVTFIAGLAYTDQRDASDTTATAANHSLNAAVAVQFSTFRFDGSALIPPSGSTRDSLRPVAYARHSTKTFTTSSIETFIFEGASMTTMTIARLRARRPIILVSLRRSVGHSAEQACADSMRVVMIDTR